MAKKAATNKKTKRKINLKTKKKSIKKKAIPAKASKGTSSKMKPTSPATVKIVSVKTPKFTLNSGHKIPVLGFGSF